MPICLSNFDRAVFPNRRAGWPHESDGAHAMMVTKHQVLWGHDPPLRNDQKRRRACTRAATRWVVLADGASLLRTTGLAYTSGLARRRRTCRRRSSSVRGSRGRQSHAMQRRGIVLDAVVVIIAFVVALTSVRRGSSRSGGPGVRR